MRGVDFIDRRFLEPEPGLPSSVALLALGLVPSLLWTAVGVPLTIWNFTDPGQRAASSPFSAGLLVVVVLANLAPFVLSGLAVVRARKRDELSWPRALRAAAPWAAIACAISFIVTMMGTGGIG